MVLNAMPEVNQRWSSDSSFTLIQGKFSIIMLRICVTVSIGKCSESTYIACSHGVWTNGISLKGMYKFGRFFWPFFKKGNIFDNMSGSL